MSDYAENGKLSVRMNQVMRRVGFEPLPESFDKLLPEARRLVASRQDALLAGMAMSEHIAKLRRHIV